jgi:hypothetical protein
MGCYRGIRVRFRRCGIGDEGEVVHGTSGEFDRHKGRECGARVDCIVLWGSFPGVQGIRETVDRQVINV